MSASRRAGCTAGRTAGRTAAAALLAGLAALAGGGGGGMPAAELDASYEAALAETRERAFAGFGADRERLARAVGRVQAYFADVTAESVRASTREVYAPDAYLNDTLAAVRGAGEIEAYFLETTANAEVVRVEFLSTAVDGVDVYVRWRMHIEASALAGGEPITSYGVTQFRFDRENRVLLHKDFWDAAGGFYEHLPVIGRFIRGARHAP